MLRLWVWTLYYAAHLICCWKQNAMFWSIYCICTFHWVWCFDGFHFKAELVYQNRRSGWALYAPPAGSGVEPQLTNDLVHFSLKIWHLVATILIIFLWINWPNFVHFMIYSVQGLEGVWFGGQMREVYYLKSGGLHSLGGLYNILVLLAFTF